jgi:hypothetical protein
MSGRILMQIRYGRYFKFSHRFAYLWMILCIKKAEKTNLTKKSHAIQKLIIDITVLVVCIKTCFWKLSISPLWLCTKNNNWQLV